MSCLERSTDEQEAAGDILMVTARNFSNYTLAAGTLMAAGFVAVQAYYARSSYVEGEETRFLERKLDICFDNFDAAANLDAALRQAVPGMKTEEVWPPQVVIMTPEKFAALQRQVAPMLDKLEAGFTKAQVLGGLDKYRAYLAQQLQGLSKRLYDINPADMTPETEENKVVLSQLSEFVGGQYLVFTGCRLVAEGEA